MEVLDKILEISNAELESVAKNGKYRSREEIESVGEIIDLIKDIHCIWEYESDDSDGYSSDGGYSNRDGGYGNSYARGRRYAKRDSMGRYSRDGRYPRYVDRAGDRMYSRDGNDAYIEQLRGMAEDAPDEQTRQSIHRMIQQMEGK